MIDIKELYTELEKKSKNIMRVIFRRYNTPIVWNQFRKIKITNFRAYR